MGQSVNLRLNKGETDSVKIGRGSILLNIMFRAPIGRFKLELIYYFTDFPPSSHPTVVCFIPVGLSSL